MKDRIEFTAKDIENRIEDCQERVREKGWSGLVLTDESNLNYYADFRTHAPRTTFTRPSFLFIPATKQPVLYVQTFLVPEAEAIAKGCRVAGFDSLLGPTAQDLYDRMEDLSMHTGIVGFELGHEQRLGFQVDTFLALRDLLGPAQVADASGLIWDQRIIKSVKEIECIRRACQATSHAHDRTFSMVRPGMTEFDIARLVEQNMLEGGAEYPGFVIITSGEGNYGRISKTNSNRVLRYGDYLWLDLGARYNGYWSDFCRSGEVGPLTPKRVALQNTVHEVTMTAVKALKPGVAVADIARICADGLRAAGHDASFDCGRMGHGMGLMSTEPPSVTIHDDTILREGMIVNLEPGIVTEFGVFDLEENCVITKTGCEILSGGSRALHRIDG